MYLRAYVLLSLGGTNEQWIASGVECVQYMMQLITNRKGPRYGDVKRSSSCAGLCPVQWQWKWRSNMVIVQSAESLDEGILLEASGALPHSASSPLLDFPYISFCFFAQKRQRIALSQLEMRPPMDQ